MPVTRQDPIDELARPPLTLVIGQVRFSPVRKMPEMVDDLQETMGHAGLERFSEEKVQQIHFGPKITTTDVTRWVFRNRKHTEAVFLTQDFIVLTTSEYARFEVFKDRLIGLVEKLCQIASPSFAEQVGKWRELVAWLAQQVLLGHSQYRRELSFIELATRFDGLDFQTRSIKRRVIVFAG